MYPQFNRKQLNIQSLHQRVHDLTVASFLPPEARPPRLSRAAMQSITTIGERLVEARRKKAARILLMGAHVIRAGVAHQLIDLMRRGFITHIAMNGAGPIHDYELALIGATCESVSRYIATGEFGLWKETGRMNDIVKRGVARGLGLGEALGQEILTGDFPYKDTSILAAAYQLKIPVTVHVGIGYDILHEHPNFDAAVYGVASYQDFLTLCHSIQNLEHGVVLCFGTAVMGPEVYLKGLAMARNVAHQKKKEIRHFTTAVFDLIKISGNTKKEAKKSNPQYYYRPWKTILVRTVADGGESFYVCGDHRNTLPHLRFAALTAEAS